MLPLIPQADYKKPGFTHNTWAIRSRDKCERLNGSVRIERDGK
jgi:hypothetical protein